MRLQDDYLDFDEPDDSSVAGYQWIPMLAQTHEDQQVAYMRYLQHNLKSLLDRGDFQLEDITNDESLLSIVDPRIPFRINGTADVLLINRKSSVANQQACWSQYGDRAPTDYQTISFIQIYGPACKLQSQGTSALLSTQSADRLERALVFFLVQRS
ncbi:unnamed protein product [Phytophthora lilii]|uniref:Unnamed protein product n=1 Tax=Phytophthora lilii TaxID=2077276 RepID=A0A9W6TC09_9STRA|nr:unnamed protein product [Phytophthora lilii]